MKTSFLIALLAGLAYGQTSTGAISGRVVDPSGAAIAGAEVRLTNQVLTGTRTLTSTASGDFLFLEVQPGTYTLQVKVDGFKQFEKSNLQLSASDRLAVGEVRLQVGSVTESIEVVAEGAQVQTESAERSGVIDSKMIMEIGARGRDVMALLQMMPGAVNDATGSDTLGQFNTPTMSGMRQNYNALNIDGISGNTARGRTAESPVNMDAIAEVKVMSTAYTAEYGTASGGVINIVTKTGSQQFHGVAYYYNRNEAFNASSFFNNRQSAPKARYRFHTVGFNLGGPVYWPGKFNAGRQKLFFFFTLETLPNQRPNSISNFTMPTELERSGDFSKSYRNCTNMAVDSTCTLYPLVDPLTKQAFPGNVIPSSRIYASSAKLLTVFPLPNATDRVVNRLAYNYQIAGYQKLPVQNETLRVDYNRSDKARFWFKAVGFSSENEGRTSPAIQNQWGLADVNYAQTMPQLGTQFTYIFTPTLVNQATFGMNLWTEQQKLSDAGLKAYQRSTYGIDIRQTYPANNPFSMIPAMSFGGITGAAAVSYDGRFPMTNDSMSFSFADNLSKVLGAHELKFGVQLQRVQYNQFRHAGGNSFPGAFSFATDANNPNDSGYAYANALLGNYTTYTEATNRVDYAPVTRITEWFAQDHWKLTRRLTADVGLRFTWALPQNPANDNAGNFVPWMFDPAKAPVFYRPAVVDGKRVVINPITKEVVPNIYAGLIVPGSGDLTNGVVTPETPGFPRAMIFGNGVLFAPRLGLAWDPFGDNKTAVRLGGGMYYSPRLDAGTLGNLFFNPPAIFTPVKYYGSVATAADGTGLLAPSNFSRDIDPHAKVVTSYHATLSVQRDIGWGTVVEAAYVGTFGRHLGANRQLNKVPYGAQFLPQNQNPQSNTPLPDNYFRPYPGHGNLPQQIFDTNSSYHSLQLQLNRRLAKGIQIGANYTWSKALAYTDGDSTTGNNGTNEVPTYLNRRVWNYGTPSYDRPNILRFTFIWDVPGLSRLIPDNAFVRHAFDGWQISNFTSFLSGRPLGVSMGTSPTINFAGGGDGVRPLMIGNPVLPKGERTFDEYFNTAAFAMPFAVSPASCTVNGCPPMTTANLGNMPIYAFRGPGVNNWDTSVYKTFRLRERVRLVFRAEAYNAFNHTQFDGVDTTLTFNAAGVNTRSTSGQLTGAREPRVVQFALRLAF